MQDALYIDATAKAHQKCRRSTCNMWETGMVRKTTILFTTALLGALAASTAGFAQEKKVSFGTNWLAQAEHGGYYQSVADGTYKKCGLDVSIVMGGPQVDGRALLLSGKIQFFMGANLLDTFNAAEQGIPTVAIAADFQKDPQIMMTHPGQGFDTFEDMKKAEAFIVSDGAIQSFFRWMGSIGFDVNKRQSYTFDPAPFVANKKSAQQGYLTSEPFAIEKATGIKPNVFLLADHGFTTYSTMIETMADTIKNDPAAVKCFVEGTATGWNNYLNGDNKAANDLIKKDNPSMSDEQLAYSINAMKANGIVMSGEAETKGIGAMSKETIDDFYKKMVAAGVVKDGIDYSKNYDLQFANHGIGKTK
jgi:NitT/TauT family transport system substrate-binding protein